MSDTVELHSKILGFLAGEFARKEGRQCIAVDLDYSPGNGFSDDPIRKWVRADEPDLFDNFAHVEKLVSSIIEIAEGEVNAKPPGKHCFRVRTHQHLSGRAFMSFALSPAYHGDETALVPNNAAARDRSGDGVIANHAGQLMRINAQMHDSTIRVLAVQNASVMAQNAELHAENIKLRREIDEARSTKDEREFQFAMAAEKNARHNAGFQMLRQLGTVVAAKIGGSDEGPGASPFMMLASEFGKSLRPDQLNVLTSKAIPMFMSTLDMAQKIMFMELMNTVTATAKESGEPRPGGAASLPASGPNGASSP